MLRASAMALLLLLCGGAAAGSGKSEPDTVTIEAQRQRKLVEHQISNFVSSITMPSEEESLARWQPPICPLVAGLPRDKGEFILARLSEVARNARAPLAPPSCKPNFLVVVTADPELLLRKWWARDPVLFNRARGLGRIKHFMHSNRAVRVWYNANAGCGDRPLQIADVGGMTYPSCVNGGLHSRLMWETVRGIESVIMVVDIRRTKDLNIGQLADYIAMVGLAEVRDDADPGPVPTILHLFSDAHTAQPTGLSSWDQSFLNALYTTPQSSVMQLAEIKLRLDRDLLP
ncbi:MAG TPA: hypothetical protein VMG11_00325 [Steroidobacteraceae bacterium]|nr:hypothetical protein [Steroidobacteraceae bacterium]